MTLRKIVVTYVADVDTANETDALLAIMDGKGRRTGTDIYELLNETCPNCGEAVWSDTEGGTLVDDRNSSVDACDGVPPWPEGWWHPACWSDRGNPKARRR